MFMLAIFNIILKIERLSFHQRNFFLKQNFTFQIVFQEKFSISDQTFSCAAIKMANILQNRAVFEITEKLYLNVELADVNFIIKNTNKKDQRIPANKAILAVRSAVFKSMFFGPLKNEGDIEIVDGDADAFKEFLQFFYLSKVTISMENLWEVVRLIDMYDIIDHVRSSGPTFEGKLTLENVCWTYQLAIYLKHERLMKTCESKIRSRIKKVFASDTFKRIDRETLKHILELSDLECDEVDVFNACLSWAKLASIEFGLDENKAQNLRLILGDCLESIRYSEMEIEEFNTIAEMHKSLFTQDEILDIRLMLTTTDYEPKIFSANPRRYKWNTHKVLECRWKPNFRTQLLEDPEIILFSSNYLALLGEIRGPGTRYDCFVNVLITAYDNLHSKDSAKKLYEGEFQAFCEYSLEINLPQPIVIKPRILYEIRLNLIDPYQKLFPNWKSARQVEKMHIKVDNDLKIDFHRRETMDCNGSGSASVSCLCFNRIYTDIY